MSDSLHHSRGEKQIMKTGFYLDWNTQEGELVAWDYAFFGCGQKMNEIGEILKLVQTEWLAKVLHGIKEKLIH